MDLYFCVIAFCCVQSLHPSLSPVLNLIGGLVPIKKHNPPLPTPAWTCEPVFIDPRGVVSSVSVADDGWLKQEGRSPSSS